MNGTKRQVLPAGLWIVATPIGNLSDFTPRARMALESANLIFCEDTRRTSILLSALELGQASKRLERLDAHTGIQKIQAWVEKLKEGGSFALVTDAGTPAVSDPGALLVACAREAGIRVTPVPGASAVVTLLSVSGFNETAFTFRGFFPRKTGEQKKELDLAASSDLSHIYLWFESPQRIGEALDVLALSYPEAQTVAGKELTKIHERIFWGSAQQVAQDVKDEVTTEGEVGEWCFAVQFPKRETNSSTESDDFDPGAAWVKALQCLLEAEVSASFAAKSVSQRFGIPKRKTYETALLIYGKKQQGGG